MNNKEFLDLRIGDSVTLDERTAPYYYFDKDDGEWINLSESSLSNIHRYKGGVKLCVTQISENNIYVTDKDGCSEVVDVKHLKLKVEDEVDEWELIKLKEGDTVTLDENTAPYGYFGIGGWVETPRLPELNGVKWTGEAPLTVVHVTPINITVEDTENQRAILQTKHLKLVEKKQETNMENVQTVHSAQSPITLEEAKANIGKTVYFIESSQPYSHSWSVWGDHEMNVNKMKDVIEGEIMNVDNEDVHVRYKTLFGEFDSSDFNPKHLSFTPPRQEGNMATGNLCPEIENPPKDETFTFKQMLEHIGNGGYAQVFTDKTANLAYHKWHDVREYAIGELEEYSKFRKVVQVDTPQNKTYLTKEDLLSLLEQLK